jgi:hypothetical protein
MFDLLRVTGGAEPFGQIEKFPFLPPSLASGAPLT